MTPQQIRGLVYLCIHLSQLIQEILVHLLLVIFSSLHIIIVLSIINWLCVGGYIGFHFGGIKVVALEYLNYTNNNA